MKRSLIFLNHWFEMQRILDFGFLKTRLLNFQKTYSYIVLLYNYLLHRVVCFLSPWVSQITYLVLIFLIYWLNKLCYKVSFRQRFYDSLNYVSSFSTYLVLTVAKGQYYHSYFRHKELETQNCQIMS